MLRFERDVAAALGAVPDHVTQAAVAAFVDGSLRSMPQHIRAGVFAASLALGSYVRLLVTVGLAQPGPQSLRQQLARWETSPLGPVRQYVRLFRSLVLFAVYEQPEHPEQAVTPPAPWPGDAPARTATGAGR